MPSSDAETAPGGPGTGRPCPNTGRARSSARTLPVATETCTLASSGASARIRRRDGIVRNFFRENAVLRRVSKRRLGNGSCPEDERRVQGEGHRRDLLLRSHAGRIRAPLASHHVPRRRRQPAAPSAVGAQVGVTSRIGLWYHVPTGTNPCRWDRRSMDRAIRRAEIIGRMEELAVSDGELAHESADADPEGRGISRMTVWRMRNGAIPTLRTLRLMDSALDAMESMSSRTGMEDTPDDGGGNNGRGRRAAHRSLPSTSDGPVGTDARVPTGAERTADAGQVASQAGRTSTL